MWAKMQQEKVSIIFSVEMYGISKGKAAFLEAL
jgi:hypothetical protein